ncbi:transcription elongation factor GreA [Candidatus Roizmanbacteria bacterium RIFCSPHIGHO2_01_FULL_35_10]|uniref:Transcription elongation factor GreA n=1 Tax=Candidatus Roizmanbacteria bacterium RIFCSPLOWO2_01_FULL_35_13 TaxID=1802055 RepID=A0A1F7I855_9BACT|nr:MAG: transcription elongation factor GreA [Candidatus Roizmanbacteria bacterium RIFCSPHIGHO2_01_FULL_35_10]OGK39523.1 MAG: transcription elongation factor GreA [Candidatus Roizmanbacteria bacterium RIFCSPLOWO2_01_FULL_35_13]
MNKVQLTQSGLENLQKELDELKNVKRSRAIQRLHTARAMGDLSENSEYTAAKEGLAFIEGRIREIEELLKNVEVVQNNKQNGKVALGNYIKVSVNNIEDELQIVGEFEADPLKKKLSSKSPIGIALLDKKVGETIEINIPAGKIKYKILQIK